MGTIPAKRQPRIGEFEMLNRHNLNIAKLAAKDESRYTLTGIRVSPDETMCTDGHQLTRVTTPKVDVEQFPVKDGFTPTRDFEPFLLPSQAALSIARALPKRSTIPILLNAAIGKQTDVNGCAQIAVTDLDDYQIFTPRKMDGKFPDYERVIPNKADATFTIGLNPLQLLAILQQVKGFVDTREPTMVLRLYDASSAVRIDVSNDEQEWTSVLMPMKLDAADKTTSKPASKPKPQAKAEAREGRSEAPARSETRYRGRSDRAERPRVVFGSRARP